MESFFWKVNKMHETDRFIDHITASPEGLEGRRRMHWRQ